MSAARIKRTNIYLSGDEQAQFLSCWANWAVAQLVYVPWIYYADITDRKVKSNMQQMKQQMAANINNLKLFCFKEETLIMLVFVHRDVWPSAHNPALNKLAVSF